MPDCLEYEKKTTGEKMKEGSDGADTLVFRPFALEDKARIDAYTKPWNLGCSDLSFANLFIWGADGKMQYAEKDNVLYIKLDFAGVPMFLWAPIPKYGAAVDYRKAVSIGIDYMRKNGTEPTFRSVWAPFREKILAVCPELFSVPTDIAWDYVYTRESLATLRGKKLHGKRNHINKFLSQYPDYEYKKLDAAMVPDCIALYDKWTDEKEIAVSVSMRDERKSVVLALQNMDALGLDGGTIFIGGRLCAFTVGERLHPQMQLIHIEKGDTAYDGIFPMINQQYVLHECQEVSLINREEDMGIAGMRQAKRSYQPVTMIEKYLISTRDLSEEKGIWEDEDEE